MSPRIHEDRYRAVTHVVWVIGVLPGSRGAQVLPYMMLFWVDEHLKPTIICFITALISYAEKSPGMSHINLFVVNVIFLTISAGRAFSSINS